MSFRNMFIAGATLLTAGLIQAQSTNVQFAPGAVKPGVSPSALNEGRAAVNRAMDWLVKQQKPDGSWSNPEFPALTAMPLWALAQGGSENKEAIDKAVKFILSNAKEDGSIYAEPKQKRKGGGLKNYNTALCMVALHATGRPEVIPVVQKARLVVAGGQHFGGDVYDGGMGYDAENNQPYADLSNSYMAYEAMRLTQNVEDQRKSGDKRADLDWEAARKFITQVQNGKADDAASEKGGFGYTPTESKAGTYTNAAGAVRFRSYGSMTYAGLLGFIYAETPKSDPRVQSAREWATKNWSLEENPGMGKQGHYYFLNVLSKGLASFGEDIVELPTGQKINWREAVINKLVNLQKIENGQGFWVNDAGRWQESDPVLATSYSIIALQIALGAK